MLSRLHAVSSGASSRWWIFVVPIYSQWTDDKFIRRRGGGLSPINTCVCHMSSRLTGVKKKQGQTLWEKTKNERKPRISLSFPVASLFQDPSSSIFLIMSILLAASNPLCFLHSETQRPDFSLVVTILTFYLTHSSPCEICWETMHWLALTAYQAMSKLICILVFG